MASLQTIVPDKHTGFLPNPDKCQYESETGEVDSPAPAMYSAIASKTMACTQQECEKDALNHALTDKCSYKNCPDCTSNKLLCKGAFKALCYAKGASGQFANVTNSVGVINAGRATAKSAEIVVEHMGSTLAPEIAAALGEIAVMGPIGAVGGALLNIIKLVNSVCKDSLSATLAKCGARVSMGAVVLSVVGLALAFTGVGVPLSGLLLGGSGVLLRKLGPMICEAGGMKAAVKKFFKSSAKTFACLLDSMMNSKAGAKLSWGGAAAVAQKLRDGAVGLVIKTLKMIWTLTWHLPKAVFHLLMAIPKSIYSGIKQVTERRANPACCMIFQAEEAETALEDATADAGFIAEIGDDEDENSPGDLTDVSVADADEDCKPEPTPKKKGRRRKKRKGRRRKRMPLN